MANIPNEEWRLAPFPEFEPLRVSSHGRVMRESGSHAEGSNDDGYLYILAQDAEGRSHKVYIQTLILGAFEGRQDHLQVNHKDYNRSNNHKDNLNYMTPQQNNQHSANRRRVCPVKQRDMNGKFIADFVSMSEASRSTGICARKICNNCKGRISNTGSHKWEYI